MLVEELNNISAKWNNLGLQLGVSVGALNAIKKDCNSTSDCLREALTKWLKTYPSPPTWSNIVNVLRCNTIGEVRLAADLEQKYCSTQDTSIAPTNHYALSAPPSQAHTWKSPLSQSTVSLTHPPAFASPYHDLLLSHPSHTPPWPSPPTCSQLHVTPGPIPSGSIPFRSIPPTPVQPTTLLSDAVQGIAAPQCTVQPGVAAGM